MKPCIVDFSTKAINSVSSGSNEIQLLIRCIRYLCVWLIDYGALQGAFPDGHFSTAEALWNLFSLPRAPHNTSISKFSVTLQEINHLWDPLAFNQSQWTWWKSSKFRLKKLTEMQKTLSHKPCLWEARKQKITSRATSQISVSTIIFQIPLKSVNQVI